MNIILGVFVLVGGIGVFAYHRTPLWMWTAVTLMSLVLVTAASNSSFNALLLIGWLVWVVMMMANFTVLRQRMFSRPMLKLFRKLLPKVSQTEQEALEAGTVWWDAELFSGKPNWDRLLRLPPPRLSPDEQAFVDGPAEELCVMVNDWQISQDLKLPDSMWAFLKSKGFLGMIIPKRYGGLGFSALGHSAVITKLATRSSNVAVSVMVPNSLGPAELLLRYGTDEQRDHYLPRLARGEEIPCFALTNPYAGSDAAAVPDRGVVCYGRRKGKKVLGMRVTWEKRYITLGPVATLLGLAFRLEDPDGLLESSGEEGITLALIPTAHKGVEIGRRHYPAGQAFQNGPNSGKDVFIPMDWIIGGQERCGQGWRMLMNCLAAGRSISLPGGSTGGLKFCTRVTGAYARVRKQFNIAIGKMEGVEEALARIAGNTYAIDAARLLTATALDQGEEPSVLSALLKYQATERMRLGINDAMDVHGGRGICHGPNNYLFNAYQAAPVSITVEGANILTRSLIVFGQGAVRCHPWLYKEIQAAQMEDAEAALREFDQALCGHIGFSLSNAWRAFFQNLTGGRLTGRPRVGYASHWYSQLERTSVSFALVADFTLMLVGGELKRRESLSGRFADVLGEMYLVTAALKHFEDEGRPAADRPLLDYVCANALYNAEQQLAGILANFPSRMAAWKLKFILFPWGMRRLPASDSLGHEVAALMLQPSDARDRLTAGMYVNTDPDDVTGCLEHALALVVEGDEIERKIRSAQRDGRVTAAERWSSIREAKELDIIGAREVALLKATDAAVRRVIDVDDFDPAALGAGDVGVAPGIGNAA